ncbi:hypothetical protein DBIPINDM_000340 [Mesorhizobium sp. AR02]|uniref:hypothetical protein n=1 Tax=Mesorhizobium sp. AR02 TaxID=2865837 RepID=UPI00216026AD|nr:hypothetical protein [Mesorhizobium sp. AR02]UVK53981.1 hypothetical protein DBIPINDM_000340 [Mesorhizobium sp. AR02]
MAKAGSEGKDIGRNKERSGERIEPRGGLRASYQVRQNGNREDEPSIVGIPGEDEC